jgi:hypothetical protein
MKVQLSDCTLPLEKNVISTLHLLEMHPMIFLRICLIFPDFFTIFVLSFDHAFCHVG